MKKQILFILATHGDEAFSVNLFKRLERVMPRDIYGYDWIIGNDKALEKRVRFTDADLNRSAPGSSNSSVYEEKRAAELIELANRYKFVIDIHGTISNTGVFTIIPKPTLQNLLFAAILPIKRNVLWFSSRSLKNGPIVQFCRPPALEIECGPRMNPKRLFQLETILKDILVRLKNLDIETAIKEVKKKDFYKVYGSQNKWNKRLEDFQLAKMGDEEFYPLLVDQYRDVAFYKMERVNFEKLFIY